MEHGAAEHTMSQWIGPEDKKQTAQSAITGGTAGAALAALLVSIVTVLVGLKTLGVPIPLPAWDISTDARFERVDTAIEQTAAAVTAISEAVKSNQETTAAIRYLVPSVALIVTGHDEMALKREIELLEAEITASSEGGYPPSPSVAATLADRRNELADLRVSMRRLRQQQLQAQTILLP